MTRGHADGGARGPHGEYDCGLKTCTARPTRCFPPPQATRARVDDTIHRLARPKAGTLSTLTVQKVDPGRVLSDERWPFGFAPS